jgi:hypothetical protein
MINDQPRMFRIVYFFFSNVEHFLKLRSQHISCISNDPLASQLVYFSHDVLEVIASAQQKRT